MTRFSLYRPIVKRTLLPLASLFLCLSCAKEPESQTGKGALSLGMRIDSKTETVASGPAVRSDATAGRDYSLKIKNGEGKLVYQYATAAEVPEEVWLLAGEYTVSAVSGANEDIAFDSPYFEGESTVTVIPDRLQPCEVVCRLANAKISVEYSERVKAQFAEYRLKAYNAKGSLIFAEDTQTAGYVKTTSGQNYVNWDIELKNFDGKAFRKSGRISDMEPCTHYILKVDVDDDYADGALVVDIRVVTDATEIDENIDIPLKKLPEIRGDGFDIATPFAVATNTVPSIRVRINGTPELESVLITHDCSYLIQNGIAPSFDLRELAADKKNELERLGLTWTEESPTDGTADFSVLGTALAAGSDGGDGRYTFTFTVRDTYGKQSVKALQIQVIDSEVITLEPQNPMQDVWAASAVLYGRWIGDVRPEGLGFEYRKKGDADWIPVDAGSIRTDEGKKQFRASLQGLEPGTAYEYRSFSGGVSSNIAELTTEAALPLTGGAFDEWHQNGKVWNPWPSGGIPFWDSGNQGATTIAASNTAPTDDKWSGKTEGKAARLETIFANVLGIGKLAAGNIFTGKYLRTDGTNGVLEFGKEYSARPLRLTGYYKYYPKTVNRIDSYPSGMSKNDFSNRPDSCHVYIALTDWDAPMEIRTADKRLFDKTDSHVIAYGELCSGETVEGADGAYVPFEIRLNYRSDNRKPKYIIVVCTASKYGDYFTGGEGSLLYLDELELRFD